MKIPTTRTLPTSTSFRLQSSFDGRNLLIKRQDIRFRADWRDLKLIDLPMALCVMFLDMGELSGVFESIVLPIAVSDPSVTD